MLVHASGLNLCLTFLFILYIFRPTTPEGVESVLSENDDQYEEETRRVSNKYSQS